MEILLRMAGDMHLHTATIQKLSRFGVWLSNLRKEAKPGTQITLAIPRATTGFVETPGTVIHVIDAVTATGHGVAPGLIVRFQEPLAEGEVDLDALRPRAAVVARRTREITGAQLAGLIAECRTQVLAGSLAEVALPTVLAMLEATRKSGRLALAHGRVTATVDLLDGRVVDAQWSELPATPPEILIALLDWTDGTFELFAANLPPRDPARTYTLAELLLEHARLRDEARRRRSLRARDEETAHEWLD